MYLTGTYRHNLDAKQRVTLPAPFRRQFDEQVCLVPVGDALYGFTPESHQAWVASFFEDGKPNPRNPKDVRLQMKLFASTVTLDLDSAGRLALGKLDATKLAKRSIERAVAVVGAGDHFEIWDADRFDREMADDDLEDLMFG